MLCGNSCADPDPDCTLNQNMVGAKVGPNVEEDVHGKTSGVVRGH